MCILVSFPSDVSGADASQGYGAVVAHPWRVQGASGVTLRHAVGFQFTHPVLEVTSTRTARGNQIEQLVGGRNLALYRDGSIRIALRGEA
jgi:hypothetical protein